MNYPQYNKEKDTISFQHKNKDGTYQDVEFDAALVPFLVQDLVSLCVRGARFNKEKRGDTDLAFLLVRSAGNLLSSHAKTDEDKLALLATVQEWVTKAEGLDKEEPRCALCSRLKSDHKGVRHMFTPKTTAEAEIEPGTRVRVKRPVGKAYPAGDDFLLPEGVMQHKEQDLYRVLFHEVRNGNNVIVASHLYSREELEPTSELKKGTRVRAKHPGPDDCGNIGRVRRKVGEQYKVIFFRPKDIYSTDFEIVGSRFYDLNELVVL